MGIHFFTSTVTVLPHAVNYDISPREILNLKISLSRLEKYHIPLVAEGESISSMTKTAKIFLIS